MLLSLDRAFILDWKLPAGFQRILTPRYIDWRFDALEANPPINHVHDIGSPNWYQEQNKSVAFYMETNFNDYFTNEQEVIQSLSYDFTYALLRNKHFRSKIKELGLNSVKCQLCCFWHYLFKYSTSFSRNLASAAKKKLGLTPGRDLIFIDISFPLERLPKRLLMQHTDEVFKCVQSVVKVLRDPVCILASNNYFLLDEVPKLYPNVVTNKGLFFTKERYQVELQYLLNSTEYSSKKSGSKIMVPKTEHNALMYFFMGYHLQLNSTVLFVSKKSQYSESMAAFRHFYHPSRYIVHSEKGCKLERYKG